MAPLQFVPFSSSISPDFWHALTRLKLQVLKLSDEPVPISAFYERGKSVLDRVTGQQVPLGCMLHFDGSSFETPHSTSGDRVYLNGTLRNFNTVEEFKSVDKMALLNELGNSIKTKAKAPVEDAASLNTFLMITFADLKKYKYYYWCAFPAVAQKPGWEVVNGWHSLDNGSMSEDELKAVETASTDLRSGFAALRSGERTARSVSQCQEGDMLVFADPSALATAPGWPLRNALTHLSSRNISSVRLVCLRESSSNSITATIRRAQSRDAASTSSAAEESIVGWEKNAQGKLSARVVDLAPLMDPTRLADQAVDLNLQLMRWRIMPSLNLERVKTTSCLLLGAGTLGCYVARTLMAWGVREITLLDNSTVSFSNPVRQPLFEYADSIDGGKPKAIAAAEALKRIYPSIDATGIQMAIPMPGHPVPPHQVEQCWRDVKRLDKLMDQHDVTYLLMDSRESRWLPSLLGASKNKLVMNVALGFDTFLVMRHGLEQDGRRPLGCYYCNDIVAPMDSLSDRTLDQMCTVTRPGIASIASSTAVELMVSVLQHPLGAHASSEINRGPELSQVSPLGIVPHQIRGMLAQFDNMKMTGASSEYCTACSQKIIEAYRDRGDELLMQVFDDASSLERITGLDQLHKDAERALEEVDFDDEEEDW